MGGSKSSSKKEVNSNKCLPQEIKISNNLNFHLRSQGKKKIKPMVSRRKKITNIKAEINKIETKETIEIINVTKSWLFGNINKIEKS